MADDLHNIPDHRGIASFGGNWASRRRREVAKDARHATRIGRRFQVPMSSVRQKSDFQAAQREANQSDLRFSISAENDHGGCRRWPRRASGRKFPEFGQFLLVAPCCRGLAAIPRRSVWNCEMSNVYRAQSKPASSKTVVVGLSLSEQLRSRATPKSMVSGAGSLMGIETLFCTSVWTHLAQLDLHGVQSD